ncbi:unnamed protein product [Heligmosomoides polygyrus]|uniref:Uncharacterized protein n=1 Tax=Heligmosomoides polygyrus TaxID=6339 RepID=A0A183G365_HELPZ|nr:unnamed protein product [Heligmosomoides polygyrus]
MPSDRTIPARVRLCLTLKHDVIGIQQRPRSCLLEISCNCIHDDREEQWGERRPLVHSDRYRELHRGTRWCSYSCMASTVPQQATKPH